MLFNSFSFILFFCVVYGLYSVFPHRWQNRMLLVASYIFYGAWDYRFLGLIVLSTCVDYVCGQAIYDAKEAQAKRGFLVFSLCINLGILFIFKYFNFFADSLYPLLNSLGLGLSQPVLKVALPVGISFYTFQTISYSVDVFCGKVKPLKNFWDFALFVSFFPQLVAGPIERATHLLPQITNSRTLSEKQIKLGIWLVALGYYQKVVVADKLAPLVDSIFSTTDPPSSGLVALIGGYAFTFQIYGDFAGYSNIARGISALMGFDLMNNFVSPYFARNPSDFWRRWHISLSTWLRDYLYIPLGGNRAGSFKTLRNLFITMLLGGLWHGAAWTFVMWGMLHGVLLVVYRLLGFIDTGYKNIREKLSLRNLLSIFLMFNLTCITWIFFRAESMQQAQILVGSVITDFSIRQGIGLGSAWWLIKVVWFMLIIDGIAWLRENNLWVLDQKLLVRSACFFWLMLSIVFWGEFRNDEFIYFQF